MDSKIFLPDALIFDVDGVLLNVEGSFPEVIRLSVLEGWEKFCLGSADSPGYTKAHERVLKRQGSFNDDYEIVWTLLTIAAASGEKKLSAAFPSPLQLELEVSGARLPLRDWAEERYGALLPYSETRKLCLRRYMGELYLKETPMLRCHWSELPLPTAIYTGRNEAEWRLAQKLLGWEDFADELVVNSDSGILKPSPEGLFHLSEKLGAKNPAFFGDTGSDLGASQAFGRGYFVALGDLLPEAEHVYDDVETALAALLDFRGGGTGNG